MLHHFLYLNIEQIQDGNKVQPELQKLETKIKNDKI